MRVEVMCGLVEANLGLSLIPYDMEVERVLQEAKARGVLRILIQAPDGLKQYLHELCQRLAGAGITPIISADPCYGACDLSLEEASFVKADMLLHVGHAEFQKARGADEEGEGEGGGRGAGITAVFIPARHFVEMGDLALLTGKLLKAKGFRRVGLVATIQHHGYIREFSDELAKQGFEAIIDSGSGGLVLGCRVEAAKRLECEVDAVVYLGGGDFHALGVAMALEKPVYVADPYRNEIRDMDALKRKTLSKRWWTIFEATKARTFGIVVVAKIGQFGWSVAARLKEQLEASRREAIIIAMDDVSWDRMAPFTFIEAFIVTGCPRIALDNRDSFVKPVLNEEEAVELLRRLRPA
jgi:2-(3-amino-3-carboxypropyl)histidine synthase